MVVRGAGVAPPPGVDPPPGVVEPGAVVPGVVPGTSAAGTPTPSPITLLTALWGPAASVHDAWACQKYVPAAPDQAFGPGSDLPAYVLGSASLDVTAKWSTRSVDGRGPSAAVVAVDATSMKTSAPAGTPLTVICQLMPPVGVTGT